MSEKRQYKRFEIFLKVDVDKGTGKTINFSRFGLLASINVSDNNVKVGDILNVKISIPDRNETVLCEGTVQHVVKSDNSSTIGVEIKTMDPSVKSDILELAYKAWGKKRHENV